MLAVPQSAGKRAALQGFAELNVGKVYSWIAVLGDEPLRDPLDRSTMDERVATVWPLTREARAVAGKEIPSHPRSAGPGSMPRRQP